MNTAEHAHLGRIKSMSCAVCGAFPPNDAHHILQGGNRIGHYATIPLCRGCHDELDLAPGDRAMWKIYKRDELKAWEQTISRLMM